MADAFVDQHGRETAGGAEIIEVARNVRVAVEHRKARSDVLTNGVAHLFRRHQAVRAESEDDLHIFIGHAETVQLVHEHGHEIEAVGHARRVVADKSHRIARPDPLCQRRAADGMCNRVEHGRPDICQRRCVGHPDRLQYAGLVERERLAAAAVGKRVFFHHRRPPAFRTNRYSIKAKIPNPATFVKENGL